MTPRERIVKAMRGEAPDRVPCSPFMIRWIRGREGCVCPAHQLKVAEELGLDPILTYGQYVWQTVANDYVYSPSGGYSYAASGLYGDLPDVGVELRIESRPDEVWYYRTFQTPAGTLNDVIQWPRPDRGYGDGPNPHRVEPLVKSVADLEALRYLYPPPRRDAVADIRLLLDQIGDRAVLAAADCAHPGGWGMEPLGPEGMLLASIEDPELLRGVCRLAQDAHLRNLRAMLQEGVEVVFDSWFQCGPSVGWSPRSYECFFLPLVREAVDLAHSYGAIYVYQDDGKMRDIIPSIVASGADVLSGLQPPEVGDVVLADIKRQFGTRVALWGGLDPCYTFDLGDPEVVRKASEQAIRDAGGGGGFILGTGEAVSPTTSRDSLLAAVQVVRESGVYGRDL
ncbi:MAG: uroporphyrinogen decarboxylase family protein [Acidobacteriota bacterium]